MKNCVLMSFHGWNKIRSDVHSCLFRAVSKYKKRWSVHKLLEVRCYSDPSRHIKELQNSIYCLNFFKKNDKNWKLRPCFLSEVTCSVLSVGMLSVFSLLRNVFFTVWEHERHGLLDIATVTKEDGFSRRVNSDFYTCNSEFISHSSALFS